MAGPEGVPKSMCTSMWCASRSWVSSSSERKVEAEQDAAGGYIQASQRNPALSNNGIFVVERETRTASDKRVVAVAEGQGIDVPQIAWVGCQGLARHADQLVTIHQNELRIYRVMRFDHPAVPHRRARSCRQILVCGCARCQQRIVAGMRPHRGEVDF